MASNPELIERVRALVAEALQVPVERITPELEFGGIPEWDSMGHMNVIMQLEERFGVPVDAELIATLTSVPLICEYIIKSGKE
jgi:acyl carrier protein